ncbi:MAG: prolipoprotein diacylglyceryl transferase [Anaerolineales bacterium]|nr:prolipoprotein diacylglyceryl transferase [Anaerolineales bacterium]
MSVAFTLPGNVPVYSFSLLLGIGATLGLFWIARQSADFAHLDSVNAGLWGLVGALLGGRAAFVIYQWPYFQTNLIEIPQVWLGGLFWPGAVLGGLVAVAIFAAVNHIQFAPLVDNLIPLVIALSVSGWLACWLDGSAYGAQSTAWYALPAWDEWSMLNLRVPTQLLGALLTTGLYSLLQFLIPRLIDSGQAASITLLGLGLINYALTYLRVDPMLIWNGLRLDAWAGIGMATLGLVGLLGLWVRNRA